MLKSLHDHVIYQQYLNAGISRITTRHIEC